MKPLKKVPKSSKTPKLSRVPSSNFGLASSTRSSGSVSSKSTSGSVGSKSSFTRNDFVIQIDNDTGAIALSTVGYRNQGTIILEMDEMPDRYKVFFAKYLLQRGK